MNYQDFTEDSEGKAGKGWSHSENIAEIILIFKRKNEIIVYITSYSKTISNYQNLKVKTK